ncbi:Glyoxylase, beta-lactamase superfamily II [Atopostipes suicloacalis DSM 15692]|uniref:Glyoxylase, beta-lactamase superfamily II n=1 Tax=Atopostipes suicloacalis DSM 15692 TaxID=1121025 RepID=A0A1M4WU51_9LACT|nr:MBL fold metallo-hydrolase [Atopostipes suicloacalis]SHE84754.1 Glyoxylase, beta-lactamase superfamily II [Atopostipes suicloacalis DSM 15692]
MLQVNALTVGPAQSNCYIISNPENHEALVVDPGAEPTTLISRIEELKVKPVAILLTHAHYDHIGAVDTLRDRYEVPVYLAAEEEEWLSNPNKNLSAMLGESVTARPAEYLFKPEEVIEIAHFTFKVVATPGHSPGGVSFIFEDDEFVITGDALFAGSVGRTDFPGSEPKELIPNIRQKLFTLPSSFTIYPGHGESSTLAHEMTTNPFFN